MKNLHDKTLALAGVFQATALVHQIATQGQCDDADMSIAVRSILMLDPPTTLAVFGSETNLQRGLHTLVVQLGDSNQARTLQIARYVITLLHLERKLASQPGVKQTLRERLARCQQQVELYGATHDNVLANLADIYAATISQLPPKLIVIGNESHLTHPKLTARIRTQLLAGIRAAVLWTQVGGNRWQILWNRKAIVQHARELQTALR
ncbi:MAG: high frequency lysogenization protein HflD [Gammaproteobacteria bacterium]|nr:high frequency lysogenization protein HflD [Gammaproteobacteria bacterium]